MVEDLLMGAGWRWNMIGSLVSNPVHPSAQTSSLSFWQHLFGGGIYIWALIRAGYWLGWSSTRGTDWWLTSTLQLFLSSFLPCEISSLFYNFMGIIKIKNCRGGGQVQVWSGGYQRRWLGILGLVSMGNSRAGVIREGCGDKLFKWSNTVNNWG